MIRNLILIYIVLSALLIVNAPARAVVERECRVVLQAKSGWSQDRKRRVYFMTGLELSRVTRVLKVERRNIDAAISQGNGLPNVVRIDTVELGVGREFTDVISHDCSNMSTSAWRPDSMVRAGAPSGACAAIRLIAGRMTTYG